MSKVIASPRTLLAYREQASSVLTQLYEFPDNSLGAERGNATEVHIYWDKHTRWLSIVDNGRGLKKLSYLFGLGFGTEGTTGDIGRFGQGATGAIVWLGDIVEIWTVRDGVRAYTRQDVKQVVEIDRDWFDIDDSQWSVAHTNNVPAELAQFTSGTLIRILVREKKQIYPSLIQQGLSRTYAAALRHGRRIVWHDDTGDIELAPWDPGQLLQTSLFTVTVRGLSATVKAGLGEQISQREAGISVSFGHREIFKTREPFGSYDGGKIFGWVDLSPSWHDQLTNNKTDLTDEGLKAELFTAIATGIKPLIELLEEEEETKFAADLRLLADVYIGPIVGRTFPPTETWEKTRRRKRKKNDPPLPPRHPQRTGIAIKVSPSNAQQLGGRWLSVDTHPDHVHVRYDAKATLVIEARQQKPVNKLLLKSMITDEFSCDLVRKYLVVKAGLFSEEEWAGYLSDETIKNDTAMLASYVKPRLFKCIRDLAEGRA